MSEVKFYLKEKKSKNVTPINLIFWFDGKKLKYATGQKIKPSNWNFNKQRATISIDGGAELNALLGKMDSDFTNEYNNLFTSGKSITPEAIKQAINEKYDKQKATPNDFFGFIDNFITSVSENRKGTTIYTYRNTLAILKEFENAKRRKIEFENINLDFYHDFIEFLTKNKGFSNNTTGKHIKNLKMFLNEATERGINAKYDFKSKRFKVLTEKTDAIYLTEAEIKNIADIDFSKNSRLERARDLFLVGCYTGLRFSDFSRITTNNIEKNLIKIRTQKTNETVVIPVHPLLNKILKKYDYNLPPSISNQRLNDYLKEIGQIAGLKEKVNVIKSKGTLKVETIARKFELVTTHTARRSFATNLYLQGFPSISIMQITGHRTEKAFMRYIKVTQEQHAKKLQQFWGENTSLKVV